MLRPAAQKIDAVPRDAGLKPTRLGGQSMRIHEYAIRNKDNLWEVTLDGRITSGQPTQMAALHYADAMAQAAAARGSWSRILVFDGDGNRLEFPTIGPAED